MPPQRLWQTSGVAVIDAVAKGVSALGMAVFIVEIILFRLVKTASYYVEILQFKVLQA